MTLKEIAAELGVSTSTVSRVLNGCHKNFTVKPELRKRILDRVAERNYRPNPMYQAMRKKENQQIAIFLPNYLETTMETDISSGVDALNNSLFEKGYSVHYLVRPLEQRATYGLPQWKVAGAVALDVRKSELIRELDESGLPYVVLNGVAGPRGSAVQADDTGNMECALKHLYELGHRKIGYLNPYRDPELIPISFSEQHYSVIRRTATYFDFCLTNGLPVLESAKDCTATTEEAVEEGIARGFTAFVTYSFELYMEVCHHLYARNLRVPADVSLVTFNNPPLARYATPPATCVEIPSREMGIEAGNLLLRHLENPDEKREKIRMLPGKLILRNSTAPAAEKLESGRLHR